MALDVFDLVARISLDSSDYDKGLDNAQKKAGGFGGAIKNGLSTAGKIGATALAATTTAVTAFGVASVNTGKEFDSSMSQVAATMGMTMEELQQQVGSVDTAYGSFSGNLRDYAKFMGSNTAFSAKQAADALNYMALAGYSVDESMTALPNVLNLAAAGGLDLATASDMVTDAQSALGLSFDESSQLIDKMAMASSKSNTSVGQLGEAILTVGGTAKTLSGGTTELATALGILADNGIKGSEGGTALRNIILSLSAPTDKAALLMQELGLQVFDAEGNMRPLNDTFGDLNAILGTMTVEERTKVLDTLFNKVDLKSANALLANSGDRFNELSGYIDDAAGAAQKMADVQLDNLQGDITLFQSALEGAKIAISDGITPVLREFVQFGTQGLSEVTRAFEEEGIGGAVSKIGELISQGIGVVIENLPSVVDAGMQLLLALVDGMIDNIPTLIDAAGQIVETIVTSISDYLNENYPELGAIFDKIVEAVRTAFDTISEVWETTLKPALDELWIFVTETLMPAISDAFNTASEIWENTLKPALSELWTFITQTLAPEVSEVWESTIKPALTELWNFITETLAPAISDAFNKASEIWEGTLKPVLTELWTFITETLAPEVSQAWNETIKPAFETVFNAVSEAWTETLQPALSELWSLIKDLAGYVSETFQPIWEKLKEFWEETLAPKITALWEALGTLWNDYLIPIGTFLTEVFEKAFKALVDIWETSVLVNLEALSGALDAIWHEVIEPLATFLSETFLKAFEAVSNFWEETLKPGIDNLREKINNFKDKHLKDVSEWVETAFVNAFKAVQQIWEDLKAAVEPLWEKIQELKEKYLEPLAEFLEGVLSDAFDGISTFWTETFLPIISDLNSALSGFKEDVLSPLATFLEETLVTAFRTVKNFIEDPVLVVVQKIIDKFSWLWDEVLSPLAEQITGTVSEAFEGFSGVLDTVFGFAETVGNYVGGALISAFEAAESIVNGVISTIQSAIAWAETALEKIQAFREDAANARAEQAANEEYNIANGIIVGAYANGGSMSSGTAWVGEYAPEILSVKNGVATVTPVRGARRGFNAVGGEQNVTINVYTTPEQDEVEVARQVQRQFTMWDTQERRAFG